MNEELNTKIKRAIRLLRSYDVFCKDKYVLELAYSGGKDSDVILQLAKEAGINFKPIYKMTTLDPPGTIKHVKEMGVEIIRPDMNFFQLVERKGLPSRRMRFCCEKLKEYPINEKVIMGVRAAESIKRNKIYKEPTSCRIVKSKHIEQVLPILSWTNQDIYEFIEDRKLKCAPIYYDDFGNFDVNRRLGCMCCPLQSYKKRLAEFRRYPKIALRYIESCKIYLQNHKNGKAYKKTNGDPYHFFLQDFLPLKKGQWDYIRYGIFGEMDYQKAFNDLIFTYK